jgi:hypothetical protein
MKTRKEIIELRARAMFESDHINNQSMVWSLHSKFAPDYIKLAEATIKADEEAGILMLVDDEPKEGDLVESNSHNVYNLDYYIVDENPKRLGDTGLIIKFWKESIWQHVTGHIMRSSVLRIIQRNNTPVYNCKKEGE